MTTWNPQANELFLKVREVRSPSERQEYLDGACAGDAALRDEVEALLEAGVRAGSFLEAPVPALVGTVDEPPVTERPGAAIGPYKLLEQIGEGGFGLVFMAEQQQPVRRKVALKIIKPGMDTRQVVARFEAERQALAMMDHPNIAKVLDGGETPPASAGGSPRPYFVMELVKGLPITDFCDQGRLTPRQRLELFVSVCQAVQHAHQKGIIHRDIKPSNVLGTVQDGQPLVKVIDFGIAKALGQQLTDKTLFTGFAQMIGTPLYMSPEQATLSNVDVDTRSDIYALGVLLYELLTGTTPFDKQRLRQVDYDEMRRIIREEEPPRPSTRISTLGQTAATVSTQRQSDPRRLRQFYRGDLDWIVMKALEKDRNRRYETASAFAADVQRYLNGEPVQARPVGRLERLVKWAKRRPALAALLGVVLLALVSLTVLSGNLIVLSGNLVSARNDADEKRQAAEAKETKARKEADKANKARDFLISIFRISETDVLGGNITARQILANAETRIPVEFADQPELRRELLAAIAQVKRGIARRVPQAMILEVRGTVALQSAAGVNKPAIPQALVNLDDRLTLAADGQVQLVFLSDFHKERLKPGREATVDWKSCEPADAIQERDNSILMTFVPLPKGTFYMGWDGLITNNPLVETKGVKAEFSWDIEIAVHDVTQGQWEMVMGGNPSWFRRDGGGSGYIRNISDEELKLFPVETVLGENVQAFIKKLNEKEAGRGYVYRLPTEFEWEYACRGGAASSKEECLHHFYFEKPTDDPSSEQANFNGSVAGWPDHKTHGKFLERTTRVGAYPPNKLGLCDMHGNVWQWCVHSYGSGQLMCRGGAWNSRWCDCRASFGSGPPPFGRSSDVGFRLVRVPVRTK